MCRGIHTKIGDPEPNVPKVFRVKYFAGPPVMEYHFRDGQTVDIWTPNGTALVIKKAAYGGRNPDRDVTERVSALVQGNRLFVVGGIHTKIGNPEPNVPKVFRVKYFAGPPVMEYHFRDGQTVDISTPDGTALEIQAATYGGRKPDRDVTKRISWLVQGNR
eukprot:Hpha_TRINITY_DN15626_c2_g1::TRINITY_DN15626_c2_g1_i4::g.100199::m.100199